jgi:hypothetical protein
MKLSFENAFNLYAQLEQAISYLCFYKTASRAVNSFTNLTKLQYSGDILNVHVLL